MKTFENSFVEFCNHLAAFNITMAILMHHSDTQLCISLQPHILQMLHNQTIQCYPYMRTTKSRHKHWLFRFYQPHEHESFSQKHCSFHFIAFTWAKLYQYYQCLCILLLSIVRTYLILGNGCVTLENPTKRNMLIHTNIFCQRNWLKPSQRNGSHRTE